MEPPNHGGRKDLVDCIAWRRHPEDLTTLDEWKREGYEREAARHPWHERFVLWAAAAVLLIVGVAPLIFVALYLYHVFFLTPPA